MPVEMPARRRREGLLTLETADGERLFARHLRPPSGVETDVCVVVAHGFGMGVDRGPLLAVAEALATRVAVLAYDARGHGRSSGLSTVGVREVLDVDAAVLAAHRLGHGRVVTLGFSMGGSAVIRHAGILGGAPPEAAVAAYRLTSPPDAVVSVSAPARWYARDTAPLRRLIWAVGSRPGRFGLRLATGARVAEWDADDETLLHPAAAAPYVAPLPLLLVHGDADGWFGVDHARALFLAARPPVALWLEPGMGHAEAGGTAELWYRLADDLPALLAGHLPGPHAAAASDGVDHP